MARTPKEAVMLLRAKKRHIRVKNTNRIVLAPWQRRLHFEPLEDRRLLDGVTAHWIGGSGNWSDPTHWDIGAVPNNSGGTTYAVVIDLPASNPVVTIDQGVTVNSLINTETILVGAGVTTVANQVDNSGVIQVTGSSAGLTLSGTVANTGDASAIAGNLRFSSATVANTGRTITADGGTVEIKNSTISGGNLRATDNAASFVQFSGDATLNDVSWEDDGAGMFRVYQTTARLLGDYADHLPAGYTLVVRIAPFLVNEAARQYRHRKCITTVTSDPRPRPGNRCDLRKKGVLRRWIRRFLGLWADLADTEATDSPPSVAEMCRVGPNWCANFAGCRTLSEI
jgi:hypothetical protein